MYRVPTLYQTLCEGLGILCIIRETGSNCSLSIVVMINPSPNRLDRIINSEIPGWNWPTELESYMLQQSIAGLVMGGAPRWLGNMEGRQIQQEGRRNYTLNHCNSSLKWDFHLLSPFLVIICFVSRERKQYSYLSLVNQGLETVIYLHSVYSLGLISLTPHLSLSGSISCPSGHR